MKNKNENNKLIAEFMGLEIKPNECGRLFRYHKEWGWIMSVVEKLESEIGAEVTIKRMQCEIAYKDSLNPKKNVKFTMASGIKINALNAVILNFIEWHNENNKK